MAEKSFGVKDLNIVGASGDPTIESNGDLNLKAGQVAIQTNISVTGVVTANNFVGDGSGLTGVVGSGSGVIIRNNGTTVGTAGSINFASNLNASTPSAGLSTVSLASNISVDRVTLTDGVSDHGYVREDTASGDLEIGCTNGLIVSADGGGILYVNLSGNVGVGSAVPSSKLDVNGTVTATAFSGDGSGLSGISGSVPANLTATTLNVSGIVTAGSFVSDLITGNGTDRGFCTRYYVTSNGASSYRFAGPGIVNTLDNPTLYLHRGFTYMFENSTGSSHPFRIQFTGTSTGVGTYVSGSQNGVQIFTVPHTAPPNYEYICTIHGGMKGSFIIPS